MTVTFETIAMPAATRAGIESKYAFNKLTVGGAALVEHEVVNADKVAARLQSALTAYKKRTGDNSKFAVRIFEDAGVQKVGVWKVADAPTPKAADPVAEPVAEPQAEVAAEVSTGELASFQ